MGEIVANISPMSESATEGEKVRTGLTLRWDEFERLCDEHQIGKSVPEKARNLGVSYQQLDHIRAGRKFLGIDTVDALIQAFGHENYPVLFERVERPQKADVR